MEKIQFGTCENCNNKKQKIIINSHYIKNKYHLLCKKCLKNIKVCSKSKCKKIFFLNDVDIKNVKLIYLENNTTHQFYKFQDIESVVINKYGSLENFQIIIDKKNQLKESKDIKHGNIKLERENELRQLYELNKLEFKNYGDAYSYINYGKPNLETVISGELTKIANKTTRRITLANELKQLNIPLDESLESCYEYINNITTKSLDDIIRCIEVEHFLKYNTNYDKLCEKYDVRKAKELAIRQYAEIKNLPKNITNDLNNIKVKFE